ncbi:down syndrome cell adhesion molecule-like protein Dscam2 [Caerostris extrusa]|uniref:Down syndrome cell adhesion molecule-like protein Dscam2 n=1 Tax=Caerostris extrusa TaxID=172846 RepID=A0AAV4M551_CAEEX|nr:down syndrome cell adhesion molecule-like protein Dscam2 [Caerostris extrusa]
MLMISQMVDVPRALSVMSFYGWVGKQIIHVDVCNIVRGSKTQFQVIISNENVQILENGSLIIKEASKEDSGHYMCQATNDVGSGLSTVVYLKVHGMYT